MLRFHQGADAAARRMSFSARALRTAAHCVGAVAIALAAAGAANAGQPGSTTDARGNKAPAAKSARRSPKVREKIMPLEERPVILVLPTDFAEAGAEELRDVITDVVTSRFETSNRFRTLYFLTGLPSIQRLVTDQGLESKDTQAPFDDNAKAAKIARALGYKLVFISAVSDYKADNQLVTMNLSARLIDVTFPQPKPIHTTSKSVELPVTNAAPPNGSYTVTAARQVAEDVMDDILGVAKPDEMSTPLPKPRPVHPSTSLMPYSGPVTGEAGLPLPLPVEPSVPR